MINSKALHILKTFTKEEIKEFEDFVNSPFHNKNKNLVKLFNVLMQYHPDFEIGSEFLFAKIYDGKEYNNDNMKKLLSELLRICENYLKVSGFLKKRFQNEFNLMEEYENRRLDNFFLLSNKKVEDEIKDYRIYASYTERINLEELKIKYFQTRNIRFSDNKNIFDKLNSAFILFLDILFSEIQSSSVFLNDFNVKNTNIMSDFVVKNFDISSVTKKLDLKNKDHQLIYILLNFIKLALNPKDEKSFLNSKKYLLEYEIMNRETCLELIDLYDALYNFCLSFLREGNEKYYAELFEICKNKFYLLKKFNLESTIHWAQFKNVVLIAIEIGETDWAEIFINENIINIPAEFREDLKNYLYSHIELERKNYEKVLEHASRVNINFHNLKIVTKILMLICFYELNEVETAITSVDSYKHFLNNNEKIEDGLKKRFNEFIKIYLKLLKFKMNPEKINEYDLGNFKKNLSNKSLRKKWILSKIEEFESKLCTKDKRKKITQSSILSSI